MFGGDWFEPEAYETGWAERVTMTRPENIKAYEAARDVYVRYAAADRPRAYQLLQAFCKAWWPWIGQGPTASEPALGKPARKVT